MNPRFSRTLVSATLLAALGCAGEKRDPATAATPAKSRFKLETKDIDGACKTMREHATDAGCSADPPEPARAAAQCGDGAIGVIAGEGGFVEVRCFGYPEPACRALWTKMQTAASTPASSASAPAPSASLAPGAP